jgi:ribonuclease Z
MRVFILGNNSALPAHGRHPTSQIVSVWGEDIMFDCGEGTQIQMQRYSIRWRRLKRIFISHLHGDHYFGLFGLLTSMSLQGRAAPLHLHGPADLQEILAVMFPAGNTILCYELVFHPHPEGAALLTDGPLYSVRCFPTEHRIPCWGFVVERKTRGRKLLPEAATGFGIPQSFFQRLKEGEDYTGPDGRVVQNELVTEEGPRPRRYAYCADTRYTESFLPHIRGVDLMYHESTYLQDNTERALSRFHSTARQAAQLAKAADAKALILGHYSSSYRDPRVFQEEAAEIFPDVQASVEGAGYEI